MPLQQWQSADDLTLAQWDQTLDRNLRAPMFLTQAPDDQTCRGCNGLEANLGGPRQFFCTPASSYVTGQVLYVDGGFSAK